MKRLSPAPALLVPLLLFGLTSCAETRVQEPWASAPELSLGQAGSHSARDAATNTAEMPSVTLKTRCGFEHESGYTVSLDAQIEASAVRGFRFFADVPQHGQCLLNLAGLTQTLDHPQIELAGQNDCAVQLWDQGEKLSLVLKNCASYCTGDAQDYLWPVLIDHQSGQCE